jgi:hypothetical protein
MKYYPFAGPANYWANLIKDLAPSLDWQDDLPEYEDDDPIETAYLGSIFRMVPSGKYYMPWCSNFTWAEGIADTRFWELLEEELPDGYWIEAGEGCPTDIFLCRRKENL